MLTPMDEYLAHQIPEPFAQVGTTDRNFYDRYYFNIHNCSDELFVVTGIGQYPNLGVKDAFVSVGVGDTQYTVRSSSELGGDRLDASTGPFRFEVLEGLRSLRLVCEPNDWGIDFDLRFDATVAALEEPKSTTWREHRKVQDTFRYAQVGAYTGTLSIHGARHDVTPDRWWGARDHSWGVRSVGEPEPPGIGIKEYQSGARGFWHNWFPIQFDDSMIKVTIDEDAVGNRVNEEAVRVPGIDTRRENEHIGRPEVDVRYHSGTREVASATLRFTDGDSTPVGPTIEVTPLRTVYLKAGSGYVYDGEWGHGVYQGPEKVQGVTTPIGEPRERLDISFLNETLSRYETDDGRVGWGMYENLLVGVHRPSGFTSPDETAP